MALGKELGIDLGTMNILIYEGGEIVLHEPSIVAIHVDEQKIVAVGQEAREMYGRTPEEIIEVMRPIQDGVIADYEVTTAMLRYFIQKISGRFRLFRPTVMIGVPYGVTSVESRAVHEAGLAAGAGTAYLIQEPLAAAIGAGMPVGTPSGNMVIDIGGGATEAAIVSMNGVVTAESERIGGLKIDQAIASYIRKKYGLVIGEITAEEIKLAIGYAIPPEDPETMEINGRDQVSGLPRAVTITSDEVSEAMREPLDAIVGVAKSVLERTPPELAADAIDRGMVLTGGGSLLRNIDRLLTRETGVPAYLIDNPLAAVAIGAGKALEMYETLRPMLPRVG